MLTLVAKSSVKFLHDPQPLPSWRVRLTSLTQSPSPLVTRLFLRDPHPPALKQPVVPPGRTSLASAQVWPWQPRITRTLPCLGKSQGFRDCLLGPGAKAAKFSLHTSSCVCSGGACILRVSQQADLQGLPCPHVQGWGWGSGSQVSAPSLLKPTAPALALSPTSVLPGVWSLLLPFSLLGWVWASRCCWPGGPPHLFGSCTLPTTLNNSPDQLSSNYPV